MVRSIFTDICAAAVPPRDRISLANQPGLECESVRSRESNFSRLPWIFEVDPTNGNVVQTGVFPTHLLNEPVDYVTVVWWCGGLEYSRDDVMLLSLPRIRALIHSAVLVRLLI